MKAEKAIELMRMYDTNKGIPTNQRVLGLNNMDTRTIKLLVEVVNILQGSTMYNVQGSTMYNAGCDEPQIEAPVEKHYYKIIRDYIMELLDEEAYDYFSQMTYGTFDYELVDKNCGNFIQRITNETDITEEQIKEYVEFLKNE